ncbi:alcohol dehydrogenase catalytic domain-containing protein [Fodinicola feengrottensis]|uniref:alcohol dehydrogenase catalytic domain-containing protein n=1 Tax=Fodinicola feengrottensis TaxID=435914 RepID=UPI00244104E4|nr:alcohol dehydrogenase catalytic domain-containing protein [Fodinicola feengrottensis]
MRVTAAGLNPMDSIMTADANTAARFGLSLPTGFGTDYAGVVDQVGAGVTGFAAGDRVFGGALSRAVADFVVIDPAGGIAANEAHHTPPMASTTAPPPPSRSPAVRHRPPSPWSTSARTTQC